jgi:hypothetical protein
MSKSVEPDSVPFTLRLLEVEDLPMVQALYEATPDVFRKLIGRPAPPDQAGNDFFQALQTPGRYQFAILFDDQQVGLADCKLDDEVAHLAHIGMLLLRPPYDDVAIIGLVARILSRWLEELGVRRLQVGVVAQDPHEQAFWRAQGFEFTGEQYRRELPGYAPRFLVMEKILTSPAE